MTSIPIKDCYSTKSMPTISIKQETYAMSLDRQGKRKQRELWRFYNGQTAYVRKWPLGATVIIISRVPDLAWPHYNVKDIYGTSWIISQLDLSSRTIETKNL
jgi:hypothetical protein